MRFDWKHNLLMWCTRIIVQKRKKWRLCGIHDSALRHVGFFSFTIMHSYSPKLDWFNSMAQQQIVEAFFFPTPLFFYVTFNIVIFRSPSSFFARVSKVKAASWIKIKKHYTLYWLSVMSEMSVPEKRCLSVSCLSESLERREVASLCSVM